MQYTVRHRLLILPALCALFLSGCIGFGKSITVADEAGFQSMARHIGPALRANGILDDDGDYLEPIVNVFGLPSDAGERLFNRLSPAFRYGPGQSTARSFAETRSEQDRVTINPRGFRLEQGAHSIAVKLIGITDWDNDGTDDWLVTCAVSSMTVRDERVYYLLVKQPESGNLRAQVLGVYECVAGRCVTYAGDRAEPEHMVVEVEVGQHSVTMPPSKNGVSYALEGESALSE